MEWGGFLIGVCVLMGLDLWTQGTSRRHAYYRLSAAMLFAGLTAGYLYLHRDPASALAFSTIYFLEYSLSIDNIFLIWVFLQQKNIPVAHQSRILFWGILGAILLRALCVQMGVALVEHFAWILNLFAIFLVYTGIQLWCKKSEAMPVEQDGRVIAILRSEGYWSDRTDRFIEWREGRGLVTAALVALLWVEGMDLLFAVDSIPAGFAISQDPFILLSANICAVLGLRSLYVLIATGTGAWLKKMQRAVPWLLVMIGMQMGLAHWIVIPAWGSLAGIFGVIACTALWGQNNGST